MRRPAPSAIASLAAAAVVAVAGCAGGPEVIGRGSTVRLVGGERVVGRYVNATAYEHYIRSQVASAAGRSEEAVAELATAITSDGASAYLRTRLAEQLLALGRLDPARESAEMALRFDDRHAEAHVVLGEIAHRRGEVAAAEKHLREALEADRGCEEAWLALARLYRERGDEDRAEGLFQDMAERLPDSASAHRELARAALSRGELPLAEQELRTALRLEPQVVPVELELARVLLSAGKPSEAEFELRRSLEHTAGDPRVADLLVQVLVMQGRGAEADAVIEGIDDRPGSRERRLATGWLLLGRGRARRALAIADELAARRTIAEVPPAAGSTGSTRAAGPGADAGVQLLRGAALTAQSRVNDAIAAFSSIPPESGDYLAAQLRLGRVLGDSGRLKEATDRLEVVRERLPAGEGTDLVTALLAELRERSGDRASAQRLLEEELTRRPRSDVLAYSLAGLLDRAGDPDRAVEIVRAILVRSPDHPEALNFIGWSFTERGIRLRDAERYLERAHALRPTSGEITDSLGWLHFKLGRLEPATRLLEVAARLAPEAPDILAHLGECYLKRDDKPRAREAFRRALAKKPEGKVRELVESRLALLEEGHTLAR